MGLAKKAWIDAQERGWSVEDDKFVCEDCVQDAHLKSVISANVVGKACSYCGQTDNADIAAPLEAVMETIAATVGYHFNEPTDAGVPWDEGAFAIEPTNTVDVLLSLPLECNDDLFEAVAGSFLNDTWVRAAGGHWSSSHDHEVMADSWQSFVVTVRHGTRFHFHQAQVSDVAGPQELEPSQVLPMLGRLIQDCGLIRSIEAGRRLFRVRVRLADSDWAPVAAELGAPPAERARAGRMNPAGIPYLYVSLEPATALAETIASPPVEAVLAAFRSARALTVVDLSDLPPLPSIFDDAHRRHRERLLFLHSFVQEISLPVKKDGTEHVDYVPSQVVCEYLAQVFRPTSLATSIDGLLYPSAVRPGGKNLVLFPERSRLAGRFECVVFEGADAQKLDDWGLIGEALGL